MDRRTFLKTTASAAAALSIAKPGNAAPSLAAGRTILPINRSWRYSSKPAANIHDPAFNDLHLERVTVPHTNIPLPWHGFDDRAYEFISAYRRPIKIPASANGKRVFVDFEGVMTASTVYCNGHKLGEYRGGYTRYDKSWSG